MEFRLPELVRGWARERPNAPALTGDGRTVSYRELDKRTSALAAALHADGMGTGDRVAHLAKNSPEQVETLFGAAKAGAVSVPLNWRLTVGELTAVLAHAQPKLLVADAEYATATRELAAAIPGIRRLVITGVDGAGDGQGGGYERWLATGSGADPGFVGDADTVVTQLYTSGTTGRPKGVQLTNANCGVLRDRAGPAARRHRKGAGHQLVPGPCRAAGVLHGAGRGAAGLHRAALHRLRRRTDHGAGAARGDGDVRLSAVPAVRADRDHRRDRATRRGGPRSWRAAGTPAAFGR